MKSAPNYWLIKSEPESYSIDHLKVDKKTAWTGIRNFQARNYIREMKIGDQVLFYHSSCKVTGVYGIAKVVSAPYPDPTQFDKKDYHYEPRATKEKPVWLAVDIAFVQKFKEPVTIVQIRESSELRSMKILQPGSRLSVTSVSPAEFKTFY
ncbi:EVE domain-containing protein [Patescibacteria group bacterium]|nr:EVE domain-containing protein [Patescibacteria group bacterium]